MSDALLSKPSRTRSVMQAYAHSHDPKWLSEDTAFTFSGIPDPVRGREAVAAVLKLFFHDAFDGSAEMLTIGADSEQGLGFLEFMFRGRHIGDFLGLAPTGKSIQIRMAGVYEIVDNAIHRAHIYFDCAALTSQLTASEIFSSSEAT